MMISSTSRGEIFSPPRLMISLSRPVMRDVAVVVHRALIAGAEPAVVERLGVGCRIVLVRRHHVRPLDDDLAGVRRAARLRPVRRRCESPGRRSARPFPACAAPAEADCSPFGAPLPSCRTLRPPACRKRAPDRCDHRRRKRRRRRPDEAQPVRRDDVRVVRRAQQDRLMHRRHAGVPRRLHFVEPAEELERVESRRAAHFAAGGERRRAARRSGRECGTAA